MAIAAVRDGAQDYLIKGQVGGNMLVRSMRYAMERKLTENRAQMAHEILDTLNRSKDVMSSITDTVRLIKLHTGFEAVGIRLRHGDDFPYYTSEGFSEDFLHKERYLCERDSTGRIVYDKQGKPVLECMCGNILCGRTDPTLPFFTQGGSFWTNSSSDLLASTSEKERQTRTRNQCNVQGYESVALIPLHSGEEIIGLLQINDHRRNRFIYEMIVVLEGLGSSIGIVLSRQWVVEELAGSEIRYRRLFEAAKDGILIIDAETGLILDVNPFLIKLLGYSQEQFLDKKLWELGFFKDITDNQINFEELMQKEYIRYEDLPLKTSDGRRIEVEFVSNVYQVNHQKVIQCNIRDITERKQAEADHTRLVLAIEQSAETVIITDVQGIIQYVNPAFEIVTGYTRKETIGQNPRFLKSGEHDQSYYHNLWETLSSGQKWEGRFINKKKDGTLYTEDAVISPVRSSSGAIINYVAVKRNVTEHLQMQKDKEKLQAQLLQAQKMEAVGRLAGGVAHDFNNILMVISGYSELIMHNLPQDNKSQRDIKEIKLAADKAALLTRQLLAFARKETISPKVLDLNDAVSGILKMIQRLVGEDIDLLWNPGQDLYRVKIDPSQLDQILLNMAVNARDAIAGVGKITIETANSILDKAYCTNNPGCLPGEYVLLAVSDNGCGMCKETVTQIFEPFFTTKELGKGTGLGLAAVFGAIKQNEGFINVYSEPGEGTTFRIYLPRFAVDGIRIAKETEREMPRGTETVLLIEDDAVILHISKQMLERLGYTVLTSAMPKKAIHLASEISGTIHLLITDVIMPEMNGHELAERLVSIKPDMKCLYMSGYTANVIAKHGVLKEGVHFIQKPFSIEDLAVKVREVLDAT